MLGAGFLESQNENLWFKDVDVESRHVILLSSLRPLRSFTLKQLASAVVKLEEHSRSNDATIKRPPGTRNALHKQRQSIYSRKKLINIEVN